MSNRKNNSEKLGVRGFYRVQIDEDGKVVGDSGWRENQITNDGITQYVVNWVLGNTASGKSVSHMAIGTGGAPVAADTTLAGQVSGGKRATVATAVIASKTAQFIAAFNSSNSYITAPANIANVGLVNISATTGGVFLCGASFASSTVATNQNLNITYELRFQ
jgi:hypothetical protein